MKQDLPSEHGLIRKDLLIQDDFFEDLHKRFYRNQKLLAKIPNPIQAYNDEAKKLDDGDEVIVGASRNGVKRILHGGEEILCVFGDKEAKIGDRFIAILDSVEGHTRATFIPISIYKEDIQ